MSSNNKDDRTLAQHRQIEWVWFEQRFVEAHDNHYSCRLPERFCYLLNQLAVPQQFENLFDTFIDARLAGVQN